MAPVPAPAPAPVPVAPVPDSSPAPQPSYFLFWCTICCGMIVCISMAVAAIMNK